MSPKSLLPSSWSHACFIAYVIPVRLNFFIIAILFLYSYLHSSAPTDYSRYFSFLISLNLFWSTYNILSPPFPLLTAPPSTIFLYLINTPSPHPTLFFTTSFKSFFFSSFVSPIPFISFFFAFFLNVVLFLSVFNFPSSSHLTSSTPLSFFPHFFLLLLYLFFPIFLPPPPFRWFSLLTSSFSPPSLCFYLIYIFLLLLLCLSYLTPFFPSFFILIISFTSFFFSSISLISFTSYFFSSISIFSFTSHLLLLYLSNLIHILILFIFPFFFHCVPN